MEATCRCGASIVTDVSPREKGWGILSDVGNGLTFRYLCPVCYARAQDLAEQLFAVTGVRYLHYPGLLRDSHDPKR